MSSLALPENGGDFGWAVCLDGPSQTSPGGKEEQLEKKGEKRIKIEIERKGEKEKEGRGTKKETRKVVHRNKKNLRIPATRTWGGPLSTP